MNILKKEITFIYMDNAEREMYYSIAKEAKNRGYKIRFTDDKLKKCEIGFYCQHDNFPRYSRFSVIMLHDIIQQYDRWPDIWYYEPWNIYDVGILPSNQWVKNWSESSKYFYANPRIGVYKVGWPKADKYVGIDKESYKLGFYKKHGLDISKRTVLYAPSWENDGKQDDFVQAMLKLDVNILIKQQQVNEEQFPDMYRAINEMRELHKDIERVTILSPKTNIFDAILASDILVSEESSTMGEALMMGIPAVSVSNWLIPDVTPSRYPSDEYSFVLKTKKEDLTGFIQNIIDDYDKVLTDLNRIRTEMFGEIGYSAGKIMDIVDDCVDDRSIRYPCLSPARRQHISIRKLAVHITRRIINIIYYDLRSRYKIVDCLWKAARLIKVRIWGEGPLI